MFARLFPVILTDNGTVFSNPLKIEFDADGGRLTSVFYCNAYASYQGQRSIAVRGDDQRWNAAPGILLAARLFISRAPGALMAPRPTYEQAGC